MLLRVLLLGMAFTACAESAPVRIRALFQGDDAPVPGLQLTALPFDAGRLLDSLERAAPTPRPEFSALEARIRTYRRDTAVEQPGGSAAVAWRATRDSVVRMARELSRQDRRAPHYREAYARFRQLYGRYVSRQAEREKVLRDFFAKDRSLAAEATRASDSLRAWELQAYRPFSALAEQRVAASGRPVGRAQTDSLGAAELELENGDWWLLARMPDPDNPFEELFWSVPMRVSAGLPFSVPLIRANATARWRH